MSIFKNREEAGELLAKRLKQLSIEQPFVFALPRGGVLVGEPIAKCFHVPLDIFTVRKIGAPHNPEFSIGAVTETGYVYFHKPYLERLGLQKKDLAGAVHKEKEELERRLSSYRKHEFPYIKNVSVIIVDDGLATGITMYAAARSLRRQDPKKIFLAVPVSSKEALLLVELFVDKTVVLYVPEDMESVGRYYEDFHQLTDEEVLKKL